MRPSKAHFVTSCQQLLALGAVLAVLTPAASVISLDVVRQAPQRSASGHADGSGHPVALSAYTREAERPTRVPTQPVDAEITNYQLTADHGAADRSTVSARTVPGGRGTTSVVSRPEPVVGYGGVGVTWDPDTRITDEDLGIEVRSRTDGDWTDWATLPYDADHAPDPDSREGRHARPGTDVMFVGDVDDVQVRATAEHVAPPAGMRLSVTAPGQPKATDEEVPAIDTSTTTRGRTTAGAVDGDTAGRLATFTPQPQIFSRAQWGANESLRDKGSLRYYEVHAGFVHHTVNANGYSRAEVPGILRSIYAYHTQSRGWSDVGYNFLVDRFGRIWEGRYGGVDRPVVGAHTLGYNDYSFAMSAIGNYDIKRPSRAMIQAYGTLFAWKLSLHGVDASSTRQRVGSDWFQAINGHRDAGQTACPGRYLYARLGRIRSLAARAQQDWSGRDLRSDLAGTRYPDLVVRRHSDKEIMVVRTGGLSGFRRPIKSPGLASGADLVVASPDLTGDKVADLLIRGNDGTARVYPGDGNGGYSSGIKPTGAFANRDLVTAVGDLDGDGNNDLVGRNPGGRLRAYFGAGDGSFTQRWIRGRWARDYTMLAATGDLDGDGHVDLLGRDKSGRLWVRPGVWPRKFGDPVAVGGSWTGSATVTGFGDFNRDGRADLFVRGAGRAPGWIVPGDGDLTFGQPLGPIRRFRRAGAVASAAGFAGEGLPDVVSRRGQTVLTYVNTGRVELERPIDTGLRAPGATALLNVGDWDRDGHGDMVLRTRRGVLILRRGDGTGHFPRVARIGRGFKNVRLLAAVGDVTGDGYPDLMGQPKGSAMRIYPGRGGDGLGASYVAHSPIKAGRQVAIGRWDGDGAPDSLFRSGRSVSLYPGNGPGGLTTRKSVKADLRGYDWTIGISDIRGHGHSDVILRQHATGRLYLWQTNAKHGFTARRLLGEGFGGYDLGG